MERREDQEAAEQILGFLSVWTQQVNEVWGGSATNRLDWGCFKGPFKGYSSGMCTQVIQHMLEFLGNDPLAHVGNYDEQGDDEGENENHFLSRIFEDKSGIGVAAAP